LRVLKSLFYYLFPITSVLVIPFIQGTTPAFLLCFIFLFLNWLLSEKKNASKFYIIFLAPLVPFILLNTLAQAGVAWFETPSITQIPIVLVDDANPTNLFLRGSIFTQLLYLIAGLSAFAFIATYYKDSEINKLFWGIRILIIYGAIEWILFMITGQNSDFLSNRSFNGEEGSGSLFQLITIGGVTLERFKSLTGEPSMFAFTVLPFWVLAFEYKRSIDIILITFSLALSFSTTFFLGLFIYIIYKLCVSSFSKKIILLFSVIAVISVLIAVAGDEISLIWNGMVVEKLAEESTSGQDRFLGFRLGLDYWTNINYWGKAFGVGFGIFRLTDFFSTTLSNNGVSGLIYWTILFFLPFIAIKSSCWSDTSKKIFPAILVVFITMMVSVPEYMYLSIWITLGLAYRELINFSYFTSDDVNK